MTNEQVKVFEQLLKDKNFKGKKQLKHILWLNTSTPKYKVGDCFIVSDPGHKVFGYPVKDFKAKVTEVVAGGGLMSESEYRYTLEMEVKCGYAKTVSKAYKSESQLYRCQRCEDNTNTLGVALSKYTEAMDI